MRPPIVLGLVLAAVASTGASASAASADAGVDVIHSLAEVAPQSSGSAVSGLTPADIADAYGLSGGTTGTVGIVIAYHDPDLEADLAVYRAQFGLPACTSASGCLTVVDQDGGTAYPASDTGWAVEESLDVQAASAACPGCRLLVVEAASPTMSAAGTAENTAVRLGATAVSNSFGAAESASWQTYSDDSFTHAGVPIVAAAGDGQDTSAVMPAALPNVIAVGGTLLTRSTAVQASALRPETLTVAAAKAAVAAAQRALATAGKRLADAKAAAKKAAKHRRTCSSHACRAAVTATAKTVKRRTAERTAAVHRLHSAEARYTAARKAAAASPAPVATPAPTSSPTPAPTPTPTPTPTATAAPTPAAPATTWTETAWTGGESGCSALVPQPSWQSSATGCRDTRAIADVAADADPASGLAVYDSYGRSGWLQVGGTSLASPLVAGMIVRSGDAARYDDASPLYADGSAFRDVTSGSQAQCWIAASCAAGTGVDLPTGVGAPASLASF